MDRAVIAYISLPLLIFVIGWLEPWAALPLAACQLYALRSLLARRSFPGRMPVTPLQLTVAVLMGCAWTLFGGTEHLFFANSDWHVRDAVLHDLVVSPWPVGYGQLDGRETMLRAPIGYYLPAALVGKCAGLSAAHAALTMWTALGASLFLLQVLSLTASRLGIALCAVVIVVFFSGFDIIGGLLSVPHFLASWDVARNLEWWAGSYVYPSMTSQLFWAPNHSLAAWLVVGLLHRGGDRTRIDSTIPILLVATALWSPFAALGLMPFVAWRMIREIRCERSWSILDPRRWVPAFAVGVIVCAYLTLDTARIPRNLAVSTTGGFDLASDLMRHAQFFLLEAGLIGFAVLSIRRSAEVVLALVVLALLPLASFGTSNDFVMRTSIPALAMLAIGACLALTGASADSFGARRKWLLGMLAIGAVTPFQEFARAVVVPAWPINLQANLIGAACGAFPEHYVVRLAHHPVERVLRAPHALSLDDQGKSACDNPAVDLLWKRGLP